jgi:hypothetical protein
MRFAGYIILALAIVHLLFAAFVGLTEGLAEGHSIWERALLLLVHPAGAAALVVMLLKPETLDRWTTRNIIGLLLCASVAGDVSEFLAIYKDTTGLNVARPLVFAVIPVLGLAYGIVLRAGRTRAGGLP